jgi:hypothetical protein
MWLLSHKRYLKDTKSVFPPPTDENCKAFHQDMESNVSFLDKSISMPYPKAHLKETQGKIQFIPQCA